MTKSITVQVFKFNNTIECENVGSFDIDSETWEDSWLLLNWMNHYVFKYSEKYHDIKFNNLGSKQILVTDKNNIKLYSLGFEG